MGRFVQGAWVETPWPTESICRRCGKCCQYTWHVGNNECGKEFLRAKGYREGSDGIFYAYSPCKQCEIRLVHNDDGRPRVNAVCRIQKDKPAICKAHGTSKDFFYPEGCAYRDFIVEHQIECKTLRILRGEEEGVY